MPQLDDRQIQQLRQQLERRREVLLDEVEAVDEQLSNGPSKEPHDQVEDAGEQGEQHVREAVVQAEQERDIDELGQIAAALQRMDRGEYGQCVDCASDIAPARLQVQPAAARCVACQEKYEQAHGNVVRIPPLE